ncbi:MAG: cysteine desulfurase family protein [Patescibacteria group bacterium]|jgi:cysteine desulfurase
MSRIYLDYAAATPLSPSAWMAMEPFLLNEYGNPSSLHLEGVRARRALDKAHAVVAECIGAHADEIIFTSGATESINLAIFGALKAGAIKGKHVVTIATEHAAVLNVFRAAGADVTLVPVDEYGRVLIADVVEAIRNNTVLISLMMVNNEIGVVQDIHEIGKAVDAWRKSNGAVYPLLHTDASQAPNYLVVDVEKLHVDLLTLSSPKVYGPKGMGALYIRRNSPWESVFSGGKQEGGRRPGTENVAGAVGFASALLETVKMRERESSRVFALREQFIEGLIAIEGVKLNGDRIHRVANNVNVSCAGIDAEELVLRLDAAGIAASTGSACGHGDEPSHALLALGLPLDDVRSSIRFSLGRLTTKEEIEKTISTVQEIIAAMR